MSDNKVRQALRNLLAAHAGKRPLGAALNAAEDALAQAGQAAPAGEVASEQSMLLSAAAKSGNEDAIKLAAQLCGALPCEDCGYIRAHCRCATPATEPAAPGYVSDREAFEAFWLATRGARKCRRELARHPLQPQTYVSDSANRHWVTWQAAASTVQGKDKP